MVGSGADGPCFVGPHHSSGGTDVSSNIPEMAALARDAKEGRRAQQECVLGSEVFLQERM